MEKNNSSFKTNCQIEKFVLNLSIKNYTDYRNQFNEILSLKEVLEHQILSKVLAIIKNNNKGEGKSKFDYNKFLNTLKSSLLSNDKEIINYLNDIFRDSSNTELSLADKFLINSAILLFSEEFSDKLRENHCDVLVELTEQEYSDLNDYKSQSINEVYSNKFFFGRRIIMNEDSKIDTINNNNNEKSNKKYIVLKLQVSTEYDFFLSFISINKINYSEEDCFLISPGTKFSIYKLKNNIIEDNCKSKELFSSLKNTYDSQVYLKNNLIYYILNEHFIKDNTLTSATYNKNILNEPTVNFNEKSYLEKMLYYHLKRLFSIPDDEEDLYKLLDKAYCLSTICNIYVYQNMLIESQKYITIVLNLYDEIKLKIDASNPKDCNLLASYYYKLFNFLSFMLCKDALPEEISILLSERLDKFPTNQYSNDYEEISYFYREKNYKDNNFIPYDFSHLWYFISNNKNNEFYKISKFESSKIYVNINSDITKISNMINKVKQYMKDYPYYYHFLLLKLENLLILKGNKYFDLYIPIKKVDAKECYDKALEISLIYGAKYPENIARIYYSMAVCYQYSNKSEYLIVVDLNNKALELIKEYNPLSTEIFIIQDGMFYAHTFQDREKAYLLSSDIIQFLLSWEESKQKYKNLANMYNRLGCAYLDDKEKQEFALEAYFQEKEYLEKAIKFNNNIIDDWDLPRYYYNISFVYNRQKNYIKKEEFLLKSIELLDELKKNGYNKENMYFNVFFNIFYIYFKNKDVEKMDQAVEGLIREGEDIITKNYFSKDRILKSLNMLYRDYKNSKGKYAEEFKQTLDIMNNINLDNI